MAKKDFYKVLGVGRTATADEIKKAYKRLAREHHPDCNQGDKCAEDKFKELSEAYSTLSDADKRKQYDLFGAGGPQAPPGWGPGGHGRGQGGGPGGGPGGGRAYTWSSGGPGGGANFEDIFGQAAAGGGGGIGDIFSEMFGGGRRGPHRSDFGSPFDADFGGQGGRDVEAELTVSFDDAIRGGTHRLTLPRRGVCPACAGAGKNRSGPSRACASCNGAGKQQVANGGTNFTVVCSACQGQGRVFTEACNSCGGGGRLSGAETVSVKVPAGVRDGGRLRIPGKGEAGADGSAGDLYLRVRVTPHPYFRREGDDLHLDVPVSMSEAALGAKIEVPTLDGKANLKVPAGTQAGATLRLKGKGAPSPKRGGHGDLYVHVQVQVPKRLDEKTKELLEELGKIEPDPRQGMF